MFRRNAARGTQTRQPQGEKSPALTNREKMVGVQEWFLPDDNIFTHLKFHGNTSWSPRDLVWQALFWSWSGRRHATDAFADATAWVRKTSAVAPLSTYQGFMNALTHWSAVFIPLLWAQLQRRMEEWGGEFWRIDGWVPIAFDGSRSTTPRTQANEQAFCAAHYGQGKTARYRKKKSKGMRRRKNERNPPQPQEPQAWVTLLWHMGLRLPWSWKLGPSNSSERAHVMELMKAGKLPKDTLFCGDAGFVGYPLWSEILRNGADFLVRVGANVNLLAESAGFQRQSNGVVLCWPKVAIRAGQPPLRLRLVKVRIGKTNVWMLTSVRAAARLSVKRIVQFYKMRWGVEIEFRGLKQTLDRGKLCCRNHARVLVELDWSIMAMAVAELLATKEQLSAKQRTRDEYTPAKRSLAQTIRALRHCLDNLSDVPPPKQDLRSRLRLAVTDSYARASSKKARYRPPNPDKKPLGNPNIRRLTAYEKTKLAVVQQIAA